MIGFTSESSPSVTTKLYPAQYCTSQRATLAKFCLFTSEQSDKGAHRLGPISEGLRHNVLLRQCVANHMKLEKTPGNTIVCLSCLYYTSLRVLSARVRKRSLS